MSSALADWTEGEPSLVLSRCTACGQHWYLPRDACPACGATSYRRQVAAGTGTVVAVTAVHRLLGVEADGPIGIALVDLDEGARVMGHCAVDVRIGQRVAATFTPLPRFVTINEGAEA